MLDTQQALERKTDELAHSLSMMRATLDSTTDGILAVDEAGQVTAFNEQFLTIWGMSREGLDTSSRDTLMERAAEHVKDPKQFVARTQQIYDAALADSIARYRSRRSRARTTNVIAIVMRAGNSRRNVTCRASVFWPSMTRRMRAI